MQLNATILVLVLLLFSSSSVYAQDCLSEEQLAGPAKTRFATESLTELAREHPRLMALIQALSDPTTTCSTIEALGFPAPRISAADGFLAEILEQAWEAEMWQNETLNLFSYHPDGTPSHVQTQIDEGGEWVNSRLSIVTLDEEGILVMLVEQEWIDGEWVNSGRQTINFDDNGYNVGFLVEAWDGAAWVGEFQSIETRDENGFLMERVFQEYEDGVWVDQVLDVYELDDMDRLASVITSVYDEDQMELVIATRRLYSYPDDMTFVGMTQVADIQMNDTTWVDISRFTTIQNAEGQDIETISELNVGTWMNSSRTLNTYNDDGQRTERITQTWDDLMSEWTNLAATFDTFDADGDILLSLGQDWGGTDWVNDNQEIYSYGEISTAAENEQPFRTVAMEIYPLPARERVYVSIDVERPVPVRIDVYDLLGRHIENLLDESASSTREVIWESTMHPPGVYFIRLQADYELQTRSVVLVQ